MCLAAIFKTGLLLNVNAGRTHCNKRSNCILDQWIIVLRRLWLGLGIVWCDVLNSIQFNILSWKRLSLMLSLETCGISAILCLFLAHRVSRLCFCPPLICHHTFLNPKCCHTAPCQTLRVVGSVMFWIPLTRELILLHGLARLILRD